jgi:hypothetical protein
MKQIMIALAMLGITCCGVNVQAQTCHSSAKTVKAHKVARLDHRSHAVKLANTYQVCREEGGYYTCCVYKNRANTRLLH